MHNHRRLTVWQRSMDLAQSIYGESESFPRSERFGLAGQMRRASVSVVSNIAEGASRRTAADFRRFIDISLGSASELDTQLELAKWIGLSSSERADSLMAQVSEIRAMLVGLRRSLHDQPPESDI
ncbi:MAG: four helix bundle protein [Acidimicrobiia bacterium]